MLENSAAPRQPVRPEVVTYVLGTFCYPTILGQAIAKSAPIPLFVEPKGMSAQNILRFGGSVISHLDERSRKPRQLNAINVRLVDAALENCYECIPAYKGAIDDFPVERVLTAKIQKIDEVEVF
jgi:hypothetical protein